MCCYLVVEQLHDTNGMFSEQVDHRLVVDELDMIELYSLVHVQLLLKLERVGVEELLKILIRVVDAQLLERV